MEIDITSILSVFFGCSTIVTYILHRNAMKRLKEIEVERAEVEADTQRFEMYEQRLTHCNEAADHLNETMIHQGETIARLNTALDEKTARIRQLTDDLIAAETELNKVNAQLVEKTEELGKCKLWLKIMQMWRCEIADCPKRKPPRPELKGRVFGEDSDPQKLVENDQ